MIEEIHLPINYEKANPSQRRVVRNKYVDLQEGLCFHCNNPLNEQPSDEVLKTPINKNLFPKSMFDHPVHLHHCHKSGNTIGAVHAKCNAYLWQYKGE